MITKVGLRDASERHRFNGDGHEYFKSPLWWAGVSLIFGFVTGYVSF